MSDTPANPASHAGEQTGATIGRYRLLEKIGEGGMGTIWMAEQREPVKRRVALKIIKLGMDTKQVIARFEAERQALAMMDHPHIAKVFDAGATESGRPYFVMEFIKGVPIVEYCDQERLDMKARLDLFTKVCHAIQHAHHKGIIHRDIKPSNVLVTMMDGAPIPKVIDFGIAKATSGDLTPKTLFTEHRQMIGTPAYMSPEQAEMSGLDVDTRSDVYSLGVLLYELLTGTTPFDTKSLLAAGRAEMMRVIREDEPHTPSHRVSALGDTGSRTAQKRQIDLKRLGLELRGDLDWIVMKCLEKDRTRRYETANGLAADIDRHLHGEPVAAGPPGTGYKLRKFVRRNRGVVAAAALVACILVLGAAGTTTGMVRALGAKQRADGEAEKAERAAEAEAKAKAAAQQNERDALAAATSAEAAQKEEAAARRRAEAIGGFVVMALKSGDAFNEGGGQDTTVLAAMDRAIADLDTGRFEDEPAVEAQLRIVIARILVNNGRAAQAEPLAVKALAIQRRIHPGDDSYVVGALNDVGIVWKHLGRAAEAEPLMVEALEMSERLFKGDHPLVAVALLNAASVKEELGRPAEAEPLHARALEMNRRLHPGDHPEVAMAMNNLAHARLALGRAADAEALYVPALEMSKRLFKGDHPRVANAQGNLAQVLQVLGRHAEAETLFLQALEMSRRLFRGDHPTIAMGLNDLAIERLELGRPAEAETALVEAVEMTRRLYPGDHPSLARALDNLGKARAELGRADEADAALSEALEMRRRLFKPGHPDLGTGLNNLAKARMQFHRWEAAEPLVVELLGSLRNLSADHPDVLNCKRDLATVYFWLHRTDKSIPLFEEVLEARERQLGRRDPTTINVIANLGANYRAANRLAEAIPLLAEAYQASREKPGAEWIASELLEAHMTAAGSGGSAETARLLTFVRELNAFEQSRLPEESRQLASGLAEFSLILLKKGLWDPAEQLARECLSIRETEIPDDWRTFNTKSMLGGALLGQKRFAEAEPLLLAGYRGMKERESSIPPQASSRIPEVLERLVKLYEAKNDAAEASRWRATLDAARPPESRPSSR